MISILLSKKLKSIVGDNYAPAYQGESAGLDLYYTGDETLAVSGGKVRKTSDLSVVKLIPTGLRVALPPNTAGLILDRGSISKTDLIRRAGVVDPGYTNEVFVNLVELPLGGEYYINPGDKLPCQLVVVPVLNQYKEVTAEEFDQAVQNAKRQLGHTGSSDK